MTTTDKNTPESATPATAATSNSKQLALLKKHFANCFDKNGNFIPAKLQEIVQDSGVELSKEGYSMNWLGKSYARLLANERIRTLLAADAEHNAKPANVNSQNLLIKGDNLEVLKHLMGAYSEQVKMIYIDPPYNTGSDGFVYQDDRKFTVDELSSLAGISDTEAKRILDFTTSSSNSHSAWLTFMYPRLYLAKELLRDDGVIFISIDDNEQAQLKILCDEVFSEENFIVDLIWRNGRTAASHFTLEHEYIICYAKNKEKLDFFQFSGDEIISDRTIKKIGEKNPSSEIHFPKGIQFDCQDKIFANEIGDAEKVIVTKGVFECKNGQLANNVTLKAGWAMKDMIESWIKGETVIDLKGQKITSFYFKNNGVLQYVKEKGTMHPKSVIENLTTKHGSAEIQNLFKAAVFNYPKPVDLIKNFIKYLPSKNLKILDFFAGSGTTAHAVMQLNAEDGGNRRFVCVQIDEKTDAKSEAFKAGYASIFDITKARIEKAASKIIADNPINTAVDGDYGFKVFETLPMFDKYLDEADELTENLKLFDANELTQADRHNLMLTWAVRDRIELTETLKPIDLNGYTAYGAKNILYFIEPNITLDAVIKLLEQLDDVENMKDFKPSKLVVFGWLIESKIQRELSEALKHYNNRKGIELTLDIRYN